MRLNGKVALISGGARGVGAATARLFAREGARVVIGDVLEREGREVASELAATGAEAVFVRLDVTGEADWERAAGEAVSRFGKLDVLVNNAGIYLRGFVEETDPGDWDRVMEVNAKGAFLGTRIAIPAMRESGGGSIVNIASFNSLVGTTTSAAYNASKAAVCLLTKSTAVQYAEDGIRANAIHPGPIRTAMFTSGFPDEEAVERRRALVPLGRIGTAEDVAHGALFLASDESSYVTGSDLVIDGGWTAQ